MTSSSFLGKVCYFTLIRKPISLGLFSQLAGNSQKALPTVPKQIMLCIKFIRKKKRRTERPRSSFLPYGLDFLATEAGEASSRQQPRKGSFVRFFPEALKSYLVLMSILSEERIFEFSRQKLNVGFWSL